MTMKHQPVETEMTGLEMFWGLINENEVFTYPFRQSQSLYLLPLGDFSSIGNNSECYAPMF